MNMHRKALLPMSSLAAKAQRGRPSIYPWQTMKVGQCFRATYAGIRGSASYWSKKLSRRFTVRVNGSNIYVCREAIR